MTTIIVLLIIVFVLKAIFSSSKSTTINSNGPKPGVIYQITTKDTRVMCRQDIFDGNKKMFTEGEIYNVAQNASILEAHLVVINNFGENIFFDFENTQFVAVR